MELAEAPLYGQRVPGRRVPAQQPIVVRRAELLQQQVLVLRQALLHLRTDIVYKVGIERR